MTPIERQVQRIATIWPTPRMSMFQKAEYVDALTPYHPDAIAAAINAVRDTWLKDIAPPPGEFTSKAQIHQRGLDAANTTRVTGTGVGCHKCRQQHGEKHGRWVGDGNLICCVEHNVMWPGTSHQQDETDPGEVTPQEWRSNALAGRYGHVMQQIAQAGGNPARPDAPPVHELARDTLQADLRDATRRNQGRAA